MDRYLTTLGSRTILSWLENCRQLLGNFEHPLTISLQIVVLAFLALLLKIILEYKRTITMTIHAWKIKGKGGSDHDIKSYEFFIKNHCVSCGWSFPNVPGREKINTFEDYKEFWNKQIKENHWNSKWGYQSVHQLFENVRKGDFIWVRCNGIYYVAEIPDKPKNLFHFDVGEIASSFDCSAMLTDINWMPVGKEDAVPGSVSTYTHNRRAITKVDNHETTLETSQYTATSYYSAILLNKTNLLPPKMIHTRSSLFNLIGYAAAEDLVALWLYDQFNYVVIPSTNKIGTQRYEFVLVDVSKKQGSYKKRRIYIQVKNGTTSLKSNDYTSLLSNKNEELWLVTTAGSIDSDKSKKIVQYYLDDSRNLIEKNYSINKLLDFAFDSTQYKHSPSLHLTVC